MCARRNAAVTFSPMPEKCDDDGVPISWADYWTPSCICSFHPSYTERLELIWRHCPNIKNICLKTTGLSSICNLGTINFEGVIVRKFSCNAKTIIKQSSETIKFLEMDSSRPPLFETPLMPSLEALRLLVSNSATKGFDYFSQMPNLALLSVNIVLDERNQNRRIHEVFAKANCCETVRHLDIFVTHQQTDRSLEEDLFKAFNQGPFLPHFPPNNHTWSRQQALFSSFFFKKKNRQLSGAADSVCLSFRQRDGSAR